jgi:hypothetical protein
MNAEGEAECAGECDGECQGSCDAQCTGTCSGSCVLEANAMVECGAEVKCKGGCDGDFTAPSCEGELNPPECNLDADCQAGCEGQASFKAECTPPSVVIQGEGSAELVATLEANLPVILNLKTKAELAVTAAGDIAGRLPDVVAELAGDIQCAASGGLAQLQAQVEASVEASASVVVSASASADVSGSASSG